MTDERVPDAVRPYYEDAIRVLEAVGAHASHVDEKTARRALQFTTPILRNLFEIPTEPAGTDRRNDSRG
jgi:mannose/cellobiose epimerase-like protein (N-acyl-D-glucosamine 2-epimerase family)